jgi:hypothetical protein
LLSASWPAAAALAITVAFFELAGWGVNTALGTIAFVITVTAVGMVIEAATRLRRRR